MEMSCTNRFLRPVEEALLPLPCCSFPPLTLNALCCLSQETGPGTKSVKNSCIQRVLERHMSTYTHIYMYILPGDCMKSAYIVTVVLSMVVQEGADRLAEIDNREGDREV